MVMVVRVKTDKLTELFFGLLIILLLSILSIALWIAVFSIPLFWSIVLVIPSFPVTLFTGLVIIAAIKN